MAVIGSNGAGKTTLFRAICGLLRASRRRGAPRRRCASPDGGRTDIARRGLAYVPAERRPVPRR